MQIFDLEEMVHDRALQAQKDGETARRAKKHRMAAILARVGDLNKEYLKLAPRIVALLKTVTNVCRYPEMLSEAGKVRIMHNRAVNAYIVRDVFDANTTAWIVETGSGEQGRFAGISVKWEDLGLHLTFNPYTAPLDLTAWNADESHIKYRVMAVEDFIDKYDELEKKVIDDIEKALQ